MGFLRHWMVSMHDDLRRTGHWLKASAWRWLYELSTSSSLLLVQSGGCICLYHVWPCSSARCRVYSWRSGMSLTCVCYLDGWLMSVREFVHVLYHHSCGLWGSVQKFVSGSYGRSGDVRLYCCVIYGWVWGQSIMLLCHRWCVCFSSLHFFMALSHCLLYNRVRRFLSAVVLNLRRCRVMSSHYSLLSSSSKHCTW